MATGNNGTSPKKKKAKPRGKPFVKGDKRINKSGRPKANKALQERFRNLTEKVASVWVEILEDVEAKPSDRIKAGELIMAYGWGRPAPMVDEDDSPKDQPLTIVVNVEGKDSETETLYQTPIGEA